MKARNSRKPVAPPSITDAEWKVMIVFWERGPSTLREVVETLGEGAGWKPRTVQTLMRRLVTKGALSVEVRYAPVFSQSDCQLDESRSFLGRVFEGRLVPFFAGMVESEEIPRDEIEALRRLLDEAEKRQSEPK